MPLSVRVSIGQVEGNLDQTRWETTGVNGVALTNGVVGGIGTVHLVVFGSQFACFLCARLSLTPSPAQTAFHAMKLAQA